VLQTEASETALGGISLQKEEPRTDRFTVNPLGLRNAGAVYCRLMRMIDTKKNVRSFITVKAHCSMTHLKQQKSLGFF